MFPLWYATKSLWIRVGYDNSKMKNNTKNIALNRARTFCPFKKNEKQVFTQIFVREYSY